jgi:hypothetical protein
MAPRKRTNNPYQPQMEQVQAQTALRYLPQENALAMLLSQAGADRNQSLAVNASTARALSEGARLAQPEVNDANRAYLAQLLQAKSTVGADTAGLSSAADPFKASSARDFANAQIRAAETTKGASNELTQRGLDAHSGAMLGAKQVMDRYGQNVDQISQQVQALKDEEGVYGSTTLKGLLADVAAQQHDTAQKKADRDVSSTNAANQNATSRIVAGVNPDGTIIPGGKADPKVKDKKGPVRLPGGARLQDPKVHGQFKDQLGTVSSQIQSMLADGDTRAEIATSLVQGEPAYKIKAGTPNPATGEKAKTDITVPAIKAMSPLVVSISLDLALDGHVSKRNLEELHRRGLSVKQLGLPTHVSKAQQLSADAVSTVQSLPLG